MSFDGFTQMHIHRLVLDPNTRAPIVILEDRQRGWLMPIWVGLFEAHAIAVRMEGIESPRPMTHDLLCNLLLDMKAHVERIEVVDLVESTYLARICLRTNGNELAVDARPSDAIALALRANSPIYVADSVLERSKLDISELEEEESETKEKDSKMSQDERWGRILARFNPPKDPEKMN